MEVTKSRKKKQEESKKRSGQWSTGAPLGRHAHFELKSLLTRSAVQRRYKNPFLSPEYIVYLHISSRGEHCTLRLYRRIIRSDFRERKSHLRYLHLSPTIPAPIASPITTPRSHIPAWLQNVIRPQAPTNTRIIRTHRCRSGWSSRDRTRDPRDHLHKLKARMNMTTTVKVVAKPTPDQHWLNQNPVLSRTMNMTTLPLLLQLRDPAVHGKYGGYAIRVWDLSYCRRPSLPL